MDENKISFSKKTVETFFSFFTYRISFDISAEDVRRR